MHCLVSYIQIFFNPLLLQDVGLIRYQFFSQSSRYRNNLEQKQGKDMTIMFTELSQKQLPRFLGRYTFPMYVQQPKEYFQNTLKLS